MIVGVKGQVLELYNDIASCLFTISTLQNSTFGQFQMIKG